MVNYKRNNPILDNVDRALVESGKRITNHGKQTTAKTQTSTSFEASKHVSESNKPTVVRNQQTIKYQQDAQKYDEVDDIKSFLDTKYQELLTHKGMILLNPMNEKNHQRIKEISRQYPYMITFSIGTGENTQMVLRYYKKEDEYTDIKELIKKGNEAYLRKDYNTCINAYQKLLNLLVAAKAFVYSKLGLCYLKTGRTELAINFLIVTTEVSKKEDGYFDFTDLINRIKNNSNSERKPRFKMDISEFKTEEFDNYGIENIDEIISYISETGEDVESACIQLGLNPEKRSLVKLIYAREYYISGDYAKGDELLRLVEVADKTPYVLKLLDEIRKNKHLYKNRSTGERLVLTPNSK